MAALVSGCGGGGPLNLILVFSGDVSSGNLKPKDYPIHGIDVSKFQGDIDWNAVVNSGVKFAWIKATAPTRASQRTGREPRPLASPMAPITSSIGAAHRSRKSATSNRLRQSRTTRSRRCSTPKGDANLTDLPPTCHPRRGHRRLQVMLQEMERHYRKRPIIYTTLDFYEANLSNGALADYPIWVRSTKHHPAVKYGSRAWHFWPVSIRRPGPGHRRQR